MKLSIIIINYKTPGLTKRCLESLLYTVRGLVEMVVVDNNSCDNSKELITTCYSDVLFIDNNENIGFGRANNQGIRKSSSDLVLLLNSDIIIPENTIEICIEKYKESSNLGVLGCKLLNEDGTHQKSTFSVASFRKLLDQNLIINKLWPMGEEPADAVMGSFMLIPRKVLDECGMFDADFFMYCEELELCHRIAKKGYKIEYFDGATAIHKHGGSTTNKEWGMKQRYLSTALLFLKVSGYSGYLLYHMLFVFNALTNLFAMWFLDRNWRRDYFNTQRYYFSNFGHYLLIPFLYSPKPGNGKRMLKRNP